LPPGFDLDQTECRKFNTQPRRSAASRLLAIVCHRGTGRCQRQSIALATDWGSSTSRPLKKYLMLREQYERRSKLTPGYSITVENFDNAHRQSESAAASYQQAIASRDTATLNLNRTDRSAGTRQWFHHQSQSCKRHLCLAGQAGDGPDRQRFISGRGVFSRKPRSRTSELAPVRRFTSWTDRLRCKERFRA
jgi:hypothetical protein